MFKSACKRRRNFKKKNNKIYDENTISFDELSSKTTKDIEMIEDITSNASPIDHGITPRIFFTDDMEKFIAQNFKKGDEEENIVDICEKNQRIEENPLSTTEDKNESNTPF